MSGAASPATYEIRVEGVLDQRWTAWFEDLEIASNHNQTVISGPVADQAAPLSSRGHARRRTPVERQSK